MMMVRRVGPLVAGGGSPVTIDVEALSQRLDCMILPRELSGQGVDFRLAFRRKRRQSRAISLEKGTWVRRLAATITGMLAPERRYQRGHPPRDLPIDHVELALRLSLRLLHAMKKMQTFGGGGHAALPGCQPMKSDSPP